MKKIDLIVRRWALIVGMAVFAVGSSTVWIANIRAQSTAENTVRISELEAWRAEQAGIARGQSLELAKQANQISVMETVLIEQAKRLDAIEGYGKWLVLGIFSLFGVSIWEKVVPRGKDESRSALKI